MSGGQPTTPEEAMEQEFRRLRLQLTATTEELHQSRQECGVLAQRCKEQGDELTHQAKMRAARRRARGRAWVAKVLQIGPVVLYLLIGMAVGNHYHRTSENPWTQGEENDHSRRWRANDWRFFTTGEAMVAGGFWPIYLTYCGVDRLVGWAIDDQADE